MISNRFVLSGVCLCGHSDAWAYAMIATAAFIPAIPVIRLVLNEEGKILNSALAGTGRVLAIYSALFAVGWLI